MIRKLDEQKMAVVICVNNQRMYQECVVYLQQQKLPADMQVEVIPIENAKYITEAYETARTLSDAKYKIYMHQDVYLIEKTCLEKMLSIFKKNSEIGMLGIAGSTELSDTGSWWDTDSDTHYGSVVQIITPEHLEMTESNSINSSYQLVKMLDGLFLMTQYDIPWRNDLLHGWHFYDSSQCMEYIKAGYKLAIPYAEKPLCYHECGRIRLNDDYDKCQQVFLHEYVNR